MDFQPGEDTRRRRTARPRGDGEQRFAAACHAQPSKHALQGKPELRPKARRRGADLAAVKIPDRPDRPHIAPERIIQDASLIAIARRGEAGAPAGKHDIRLVTPIDDRDAIALAKEARLEVRDKARFVHGPAQPGNSELNAQRERERGRENRGRLQSGRRGGHSHKE